MISKASMTSITCGVAFVGAAGLFTASLGAQSLSSRVNTLKNGSATFSYPTRAGVCGNGRSIVARNSSNPDDFDILEFSDDGSSMSWNSRSRQNMVQNCQPGPAHVQLITDNGRITRIAVTVAGDTPGGTNLGDVTAQEASQTLLALAAGNTVSSDKVASRAVFAAALSDATEQTTTELLAMSHKTSLPVDVRRDVVYWMNRSDEPRVVNRLKELLADRGEDERVRESALYALSRHNSPEIVQLLLNTARNSDEKKLKSSAVFWLGQLAGDKSTAGLKSILDDDSEDMEVRDAAVFALSNQKSETSIPMLMDVATKSKEPHLRRTALFWLGNKHSEDPRVLKLFEDILTKN